MESELQISNAEAWLIVVFAVALVLFLIWFVFQLHEKYENQKNRYRNLALALFVLNKETGAVDDFVRNAEKQGHEAEKAWAKAKRPNINETKKYAAAVVKHNQLLKRANGLKSSSQPLKTAMKLGKKRYDKEESNSWYLNSLY
jgi:cbb3-type cytochrome oxidase subunit 3